MKKIYNSRFDETYVYDRLENGLTVFIFHKPEFISTSCCFGTPYGALNIHQKIDGRSYSFHPGIAHFLEHKLFETEGKDILGIYSSMGASVNAFTSYRETVYYFSTPDHDVRRPLELLLDFVQDLDISEESVESEKPIICQELAMYRQMPDTCLVNRMYEAMYQVYPLKYDVGGDDESVQAITLDELKTCYGLNYHPSNMVLSIVSPIEPEQLLSIVKENQRKKTFREMPKILADDPVEPAEVVEQECTITKDIGKGKHIYAIKLKPDFKDEMDAAVREFAVTTYLKAYFSELNPDYQKWMDEGIINDYFGFEADFSYETANLLFYIENDDPAILKDLIDNSLKQDLLSEDVLLQLKRRFLGGTFYAFNDAEDFNIGFIREYLHGVDYFRFAEEIEKLTFEEVCRIFHSLDLSRCTLVHMLPKTS